MKREVTAEETIQHMNGGYDIIPVSYTHLDVYKRQGYSEEYLDAYSLHLYAYADAGIEKETAEELSLIHICD